MHNQYSEAHRQFLHDNKELTRKELTRLFNEKFGKSMTVSAISSYCKKHGFTTGRNGRFPKGEKPWNTGVKGVCKPNSGSFCKGMKPINQKPIGHERICSKDGFILMKVAEENPYTGTFGRYVHKHKYIWEQHHGAIPEGHVIRFKDGNKLNCDIGNLVCVSKALNLRMNKNHVNQLPDELKQTGMLISKLEVAVFEAQKPER
ncbi:HNH endonuclease [Vibrio cholerae]|nr:HNH endonuclease [Vibrio cholerae]ELE2164736.1 HNH endonuclease [Vibrio fluvialis]